MKAVYYYRDRTGSAGFLLPEDKALLDRLFTHGSRPTKEQLCGKRCWLYARVDGRDTDPSVIHALALQMDSLRQFAGEHGMHVAGMTREAMSGWNADRPGLRELKRAAANGEMDYVLARTPDRIIRSPDIRMLLRYEDDLHALGVEILCIEELK